MESMRNTSLDMSNCALCISAFYFNRFSFHQVQSMEEAAELGASTFSVSVTKLLPKSWLQMKIDSNSNVGEKILRILNHFIHRYMKIQNVQKYKTKRQTVKDGRVFQNQDSFTYSGFGFKFFIAPAAEQQYYLNPRDFFH